MSSVVLSDTDEEMDKYMEADLVLQNAPPMNIITNKKLAYNTATQQNDVLLPLSAGGYVKVGEEPRDRSQEIQQYATELQNMNMPFDMSDFTAAGFSEDEIKAANVMPQTQPKSGRTEPLREGEQLLEMRSGDDIVAPNTPTMRQNLTDRLYLKGPPEGDETGARGELREIFKLFGIDQNTARKLAEGIYGNPESTRDLGIGLADFTPAGLFFGAQEGLQTFERGRNSGDILTMGMGALEAGLSFLEAIPLTAAGAKGAKAAIPAMRETLKAVGQRLNQPGPMPDTLGSNLGNLFAPKEAEVVTTALPDQAVATEAKAQITSQKQNYPSNKGWLQEDMEVSGVKQKKDGKIEVTYKEIPYNFHIPPEGVELPQWEKTIQRKTVNEIKKLAQRAASGDAAAKAIISEANWYRSMRARMRTEFGGLGDLMADLLGTTSAQTGVTQNWDNAVEIMRRFTRGEFDQEIRMYEEMLAKGEANPIKLGQLHKDENSPFRLITKASGQLFNANSPSSTRALLDMFRVAQGSPKTPNFTGNLIGYTNAATIDVWAARFLRRMSGQKRLPPPVEKGVAGQHLKGSTLQQPMVGSEFGFGQRVIDAAVNEINKKNIIKNVAPEIGDMGPDDLQAVLWFLEKEIWTSKGWTSKAGEGGSLDFEASLAGAADQPRVKTLREIINKKYTPPKPLKQKANETDEAYRLRMEEREATARELYDQTKQSAQEELIGTQAPLARYVLGISVERPGQRPTNVQQAQTALQLGEPAKDDPSVVMYQVNNTYGRFMQEDERAFNAEFVVRENFNPTAVKTKMVEVAKSADQDAAFISKVVPERTTDSRPGVEIFFRTRQDADFARNLSDKLTEYGVDGFTFITDTRVSDLPGRQVDLNEEAVAGINGLRFQYIPEFDMGADAWKAMSPEEKAAKIDEIEDAFDDIVVDILSQSSDISNASVMHYETEVIERTGYDAILRTPPL